MQITSPPRWFRIVSMAIAVLPVERSPMISSRCPRPIGIIESIAFSPVCRGSFGLALDHARRLELQRPALGRLDRPQTIEEGLPSGSTTRPSSPSPTGTLITSPVRRTGSPSFMVPLSKSAVPTLSSSRLKAMPTTPCSSSSRSSATQFSRPWMRAIRHRPGGRCRPRRGRCSTSNSLIRSLRIDVISSGRSFKALSFVREGGFR